MKNRVIHACANTHTQMCLGELGTVNLGMHILNKCFLVGFQFDRLEATLFGNRNYPVSNPHMFADASSVTQPRHFAQRFHRGHYNAASQTVSRFHTCRPIQQLPSRIINIDIA